MELERQFFNCVGVVSVFMFFHIHIQNVIAEVEIRRMWWPRPSTAKMSIEVTPDN
jgi:hypothetical protein